MLRPFNLQSELNSTSSIAAAAQESAFLLIVYFAQYELRTADFQDQVQFSAVVAVGDGGGVDRREIKTYRIKEIIKTEPSTSSCCAS